MAIADADWGSVDVDEVGINRAIDGEAGILRDFTADVVVFDEADDDLRHIGRLTGWIGWNVSAYEMWDGADAISSDAERLGAVCEELSRRLLKEAATKVTNVILLDDLVLKEAAWGHRMTGRIVEQLVDLFRLGTEITLVVIGDEPLSQSGDVLPDGPEWPAIADRVRGALSDSGFTRWGDSRVWWRLVGRISKRGRVWTESVSTID